MYTVYWIKKFDHIDFNSQGYIGITKHFKRRLREHSKGSNLHLKRAISKYGWNNLVTVVIAENIDQELALLIEEMLRPNNQIGWNITKGGGLPPRNPSFGCNNSCSKGLVYATSIKTGELIILNGKRDMINKGFLPKHVYACLTGKRKTHNSHTYTRSEKKHYVDRTPI
jgi:predicted GIY-YIG superfamily endonuclease